MSSENVGAKKRKIIIIQQASVYSAVQCQADCKNNKIPESINYFRVVSFLNAACEVHTFANASYENL